MHPLVISQIFRFKNIITSIHFNKKDNQKLKHGGKKLKITKDVKLFKTNISF